MIYKIYDNGKIRDMTPEEIKAMQEAQAKLPKPQPTEAQRIADLEAQNAELRRMIEALANGDTGVTA